MTDVFEPKKRSEVMARVKSKGTKIELELRTLIYQHGLRGYRVHYKGLPGRPDIAFTRYKLAIFVDGCFWHGCPKCYTKPETNSRFWSDKLLENRCRDARVNEELEQLGWHVLRLWEHEVEKAPELCIQKIQEYLTKLKKGGG